VFRVRAVILTAVAIAVAAVVWHRLPARSEVYAPFDVWGAMGRPLTGRAITVTVNRAEIAPEIRVDATRVAAVGQWVVVDATIRPVDRPALPHAELIVGDASYTPTDRLPPGSTLSTLIQPGFAKDGAWAFDVAPAALESHGPMTLRTWVGDGHLDSRLNIVIDDRISRPEVVSLTPTTRGAS
jgi:hypothetical protein